MHTVNCTFTHTTVHRLHAHGDYSTCMHVHAAAEPFGAVSTATTRYDGDTSLPPARACVSCVRALSYTCPPRSAPPPHVCPSVSPPVSLSPAFSPVVSRVSLTVLWRMSCGHYTARHSACVACAPPSPLPRPPLIPSLIVGRSHPAPPHTQPCSPPCLAHIPHIHIHIHTHTLLSTVGLHSILSSPSLRTLRH